MLSFGSIPVFNVPARSTETSEYVIENFFVKINCLCSTVSIKRVADPFGIKISVPRIIGPKLNNKRSLF